MATAYYAAKETTTKVHITVYDAQSGPGLGGASSSPVTLLHPFTPKGKVIWKGLEGFQAMLDIMKDTGYNSQQSRHAKDMRIIRLFYDQKRFEKYKRQLDKCSQEVRRFVLKMYVLLCIIF